MGYLLATFAGEAMSRKSAKGAADKAAMAQWLFDNSRDLMQVVGRDGALLQVNRAWCEFTGLSAAELIGRSAVSYTHLTLPTIYSV